MDVFVFGCSVDEAKWFAQCATRYHMHIETIAHKAMLDNVHLAKGYSCISVLSTPLSREVIEKLFELGVRFISTRTVGYDHIDLATCKRLGIHVSNVTYAPESVADYTIMLILMTLRHMKLIMQSAEVQDYSFAHVQGRNLKGRVVGVVGTGRIGSTLIQHLQGFGCEMLAHSSHRISILKPFVEYVDLDTLFQKSDIISLHVPLNETTKHMINEQSIKKMKRGVIIINTARGALIDNQALIRGIEQHHIGGAALDVVEGETGIYYNNKKGYINQQREMAILKAFPNVIMSPHMAFLTEESCRDMVEHSIDSCIAFQQEKEDPWRIC